MDNTHEFMQVVTTVANRADAQRIAAVLVERRLAACVQIDGPIESVYRWEGKIEMAAEWRLSIKARGETFAPLEAAIRELHPYQVPEIIAVPIVLGSEAYLAWLRTETGSS